MPDLPLLAGGPSETLRATLTANASVNTKAATWTQLTASTLYETNWLIVVLQALSAGPASVAVDLGVGAASAEQVLVANLFAKIGTTTAPPDANWLLPIAVPRGSRLSARSQCTTGSATVVLSVYTLSGPVGGAAGMTRCETGGFTAASTTATELPDSGGVLNTDSAWGQLIASTAFDYRWLCVSFSTSATVLSARSQILCDIGVGAGGSEQVAVNDCFVLGSTIDNMLRPMVMCFPVAIAAGSRVSGRYRNQSIILADRRMSMITYGVG